MEKVVLMGKIEGRRDCGKQRLAYLGSIGAWLGRKTEEIMHMVDHRGK